MSTQPLPIWLTLILVAMGLLVVVAVGIYSFNVAISPPTLHENAQAVTSVQEVVPSQEWTDAVRTAQERARAAVVEQNQPGLSVAVGVRGEIVWAEGFGWADLEKRTPVTPRTRFRIGHVSKALTSAGAGLLLEQGRLRLHDEIQRYVPDFPMKQWPITLRHLMGHVSGLRHYEGEDYSSTVHCESASDALKTFEDAPLLFQPDTQSSYSSFGWVLVSAAIEAVEKQPFFTFMREKVFEPLGMADTTADAGAAPVPNRATFYYKRFGLEIVNDIDCSCLAGASGFLSTPSDLVRFGLAMNSGQLLKPDTVTTLQTRQDLLSGEQTSFGLGWMLDSTELAGAPARMVGHTSKSLRGGSASFWIFPERGIVVAVTTNLSFANPRATALEIAEIFAKSGGRPAGR